MRAGTSCGASMARAIVALGNPDRADDGVALAVIEGLTPPEGVEIIPAVKTGLDLALTLVCYRKVLVVDAFPAFSPGEVALLRLEDWVGGGLDFPHGVDLLSAFLALAEAGFSVPEVQVLAIGVPKELPFRRGLSPQVAAALSKAKGVVEEWLAS